MKRHTARGSRRRSANAEGQGHVHAVNKDGNAEENGQCGQSFQHFVLVRMMMLANASRVLLDIRIGIRCFQGRDVS